MTTRPPIPAPPHHGGCLCGAVRFKADARPMAANGCHCTDCKKLTGATHLLMLVWPRAAFSHHGQTVRWRKTADSGRQIDIVRCAACGVRLWHEPASSPELVFVAGGVLDDPSWVVPATHIWIERASPGVLMQDDATCIEGQPASRQMLFDAFSALYPG